MRQVREWPVLAWMPATEQVISRLPIFFARSLLPALLCMLLVISGCSASRQTARTDTVLGRADPGHVYWLERQSMLGAAPALLREVSATSRLWRFPAAPSRPEALLAGSGLWLTVSPQTFMTSSGQPLLRELATPSSLALWRALGLGGLFVEYGLESGRAWFPRRSATTADDDATSLQLAQDVGSDADWTVLMTRGLEHGVQLGSDLPGLATGYGPDFILAASGLRDWPGAYLMLEVPHAFWGLLPVTPSGGPGVALPEASVTRLVAEGVLPTSLAHEQAWAATDEVRGHDGGLRRWVYVFHGEPHRPVLYADDPSGAARRLLSAAIIQETGLRRTPLVRLHAKAANVFPASEEADSPAILRDLAREIRRYGGWSLSTEPWPATRANQTDGPDFVFDTVTWPALEWAVLRGDVRPLGAALDAGLRVDQRRLWRPLSVEKTLDLTPFGGPRVRSTLPGLAALRFGLTDPADPAGALSPEMLRRVLDLHVLALRVRASLPGLFALAGADLTGLIDVTAPESTARQEAAWLFSAWSLGGEAHGSASQRGVARGRTLYPSPLAQMTQGTSFVNAVRQMSELRTTYRLAEGVLRERLATGHPGLLAWLTTLPDSAAASPSGGLLLTVANFSDTVQTATLTLPQKGQGRDLLDPASPPLTPDTRVLALEIPPFGCRLVLFPVSAP